MGVGLELEDIASAGWVHLVVRRATMHKGEVGRAEHRGHPAVDKTYRRISWKISVSPVTAAFTVAKS